MGHDDKLLLTSDREALEQFLDAQREGLLRTLVGLDDASARRTPTASSLSLLGLVKHSAIWERRWFQVVVAGHPDPDGWPSAAHDREEADLVVDERDTVDHWVTRYREEIERSRAVTASTGLDDVCARVDILECNLRFVLFHMIEEIARHAGHADIIRESIDGTTGL